MGKFIVVSFLVALIGLSFVVSFFENEPVLMPVGTKIENVDVGGLPLREAEIVLGRLPEPKNDYFRVKGREFVLVPDKVGFVTNKKELIKRELAYASEQSFWQKVFKSKKGRVVRMRFVLNEDKIDEFVDRISRKFYKAPVDAKFVLTSDGPSVVKSRSGQKIVKSDFRNSVVKSLMDLKSNYVVVKPVSVKAKVHSVSQVMKNNFTSIVIKKSLRKAYLYKGFRKVRTYNVAIGAPGHESPRGRFSVTSMSKNPVWHVPNSAWAGSLAGSVIPPGPNNPLKARWIGITNGVGFHGTAEDDSIGKAASHGCFRMHVKDVINLYDKVEVGVPVLII